MSDKTNTPAATTYRLTREDWLQRAVDVARPMFVQVGFPLPERVHVSVGFGGSGAGKYEKFVEGVTWHTSVSADEVNHVFISPAVADTAHVLEVLFHELIHVALDNEDGHKGRFAECATRLGFVAPFPCAVTDIATTAEFMTIAAELGEYPHAKLTIPSRQDAPVGNLIPVGGGTGGRVSSGPKTQTNRWISFTCPVHDAPVRMSRTKAALGAPYCGHRDAETGVPCLQEMKER